MLFARFFDGVAGSAFLSVAGKRIMRTEAIWLADIPKGGSVGDVSLQCEQILSSPL